jgi:hypothetical protein
LAAGTISEQSPGTNSLGAAGASGGTPVGGGISRGLTKTRERESDTQDKRENSKSDQAINSICRGC